MTQTMKQLLLALPLLLTQALHAQWTTRHVKFKEGEHMHLVPWGDHYVAVGATERIVPYEGHPNSYRCNLTAFVRKLDRDLNTVAETRFPEQMHPTFLGVKVTADRIYLHGQHVDAAGWKQPRLACLDHLLRLRWDKQFTLKGSTHAGALSMTILPDGDLLCSSNGDGAGGTTNKGLYHFLLSPDGELRWMRNHMRGRNIWHGFTSGISLADGSIVVTGYTYPSPVEKPNLGYDLTVWKMDRATGALIWERKHRLPSTTHASQYGPDDPKPKGGVLLPDGNLAYTGIFETHDGVTNYRNMVLILSPEGAVIDFRTWTNADMAEMGGLVQSADGQLFAASVASYLSWFKHKEQRWLEVYRLDDRMQVADMQRIEAPHFNLRDGGYLHAGVGSDLVFQSPYEAILLQQQP